MTPYRRIAANADDFWRYVGKNLRRTAVSLSHLCIRAPDLHHCAPPSMLRASHDQAEMPMLETPFSPDSYCSVLSALGSPNVGQSIERKAATPRENAEYVVETAEHQGVLLRTSPRFYCLRADFMGCSYLVPQMIKFFP